jgi:hypothetical protein
MCLVLRQTLDFDLLGGGIPNCRLNDLAHDAQVTLVCFR